MRTILKPSTAHCTAFVVWFHNYVYYRRLSANHQGLTSSCRVLSCQRLMPTELSFGTALCQCEHVHACHRAYVKRQFVVFSLWFASQKGVIPATNETLKGRHNVTSHDSGRTSSMVSLKGTCSQNSREWLSAAVAAAANLCRGPMLLDEQQCQHRCLHLM